VSITSYAQNFEDVMLWRALGHIEHGFYIDIGAQDPIIDSVSLAFHEHGWRGIHVEPTPHYAELLRQQRPGDKVIQAAVGKGPAKLPFFEIPDTGISTADPVIAEQHRERGFDVHEITVPCIALSAVFKTCAGSEIHWLKIDVEGFEKQVLSSWGKSAARPWIVVVESTLPLTQIETHESWEALLLGYGYTPVYFDGLNRYYVSDTHPELKSAFLTPPNVFDGFALNGTASATFRHLIKERCEKQISETLAQIEQQKQTANTEIERLHLHISGLDKSHAEREQTLSEQTEQLRREHTEREQQLHQQLQAEQQQLRQLETNWTEREQTLAQQLQAGQQELRRLEQDRAQREKEHAEQTSQTRQELETLLRTQAQREQEVAEQLLANQRQAEQEKVEQARSHSEQERALQRQHTEREQTLAQQLQAGQQELHRLEQDRAQREKEHAEQTSQTRQELETLLRTQAQREQEVAAQLLTIQRQAEKEKSEQARSHSEQQRALHREHTEREQQLHQQRQAAQQQLRNLETNWAERERHLTEQSSQAQQEINALLNKQVQREQAVATQLLNFQQQTEREKTAQAQQHTAQTEQLRREHAEREQQLSDQIATLQHQLHTLTLNTQQLGFDLSNKQDEFNRLLQATATLETQLNTQLHAEQYTSQQLRQTLAELEQSLQQIVTSRTWRLTAPLRWLAAHTNSKPGSANPSPVPQVLSAESTNIPTDIPDQSIPLQLPQEPIMPLFQTTTDPNLPASNLLQLLALHDQAFIHAAYQKLLGRHSDPEGLAYYLGRLRSGVSKIHILAQLRLSPESKVHTVTIPGLDDAVSLHRFLRLPVLGAILRILGWHDVGDQTQQKLNAAENKLHLFMGENNLRLNQIEQTITALNGLIVRQAQMQHTELKTKSVTQSSQANPTVIQEESIGFARLVPHEKDIYWQLQTAIAKNSTSKKAS
jgi:FkbM family methyltransferase